MLKWAWEENTLHLSEVAQSSSQHLPPPSSTHPSVWCAHIANVRLLKHTNMLSKACLETKWSAICEGIFYSSVKRCQQRVRSCFSLNTNLRILKKDSALWSFQLSGFVIAVKLNTASHSTEHSTLVSRWVFAIFHIAVCQASDFSFLTLKQTSSPICS